MIQTNHVLKTLTFALLAAAAAVFAGEPQARLITPQEACLVQGAGDPPPIGRHCEEFYAQHACNTKNGVGNCGQSGQSCKSCRKASAAPTAKSARCESGGTTCSENGGGNYDCGIEWDGECYYDELRELHFCTYVTATTRVCTKDITKICIP